MRNVYQIENLAETTSLEKPAILAVIGSPIAHSASPQMHQAALDFHEIPNSYVRLEIAPGRVAEGFLKMRELGFVGCNVTVPHKFEAMQLCTELSPLAEKLGVVNTVIFQEGKIIGHNTDGSGLSAAITEDFGLDCSEISIAIIGAGGGAGQAFATQFALSGTPHLSLINRSFPKIDALAEKLSRIAGGAKINKFSLQSEAAQIACQNADLIIQTSSLGLKDDDPEIIPSSIFTGKQCVYDTIYKPVETRFLKAARINNCRTANGLSLLIYQGALAFQHWFPDTSPLEKMREALR